MPTPRALNKQVSAEVRAQRAWTARVVGATWAQAAEAAGYFDAATAHRAVKRYFGEVPVPDKVESRELWRARLEHLWRLSLEDVTKRRPGAVRAAVAVAQRASALDGLDAPTRHEVIDPTPEQIQEVVTRLVEAQGQPAIEADILDLEALDDEPNAPGGRGTSGD